MPQKSVRIYILWPSQKTPIWVKLSVNAVGQAQLVESVKGHFHVEQGQQHYCHYFQMVKVLQDQLHKILRYQQDYPRDSLLMGLNHTNWTTFD